MSGIIEGSIGKRICMIDRGEGCVERIRKEGRERMCKRGILGIQKEVEYKLHNTYGERGRLIIRG